jgi:glutathione synthase/RimK-type ligase-like ATP-grasp enzyme
VDWAAFDLVLVRSIWDADRRRDEFVAWAHRVEATVPMLNPAAVLEWNTDKRYLRELPDAGLPTVPTRFLDPGEGLNEDVVAALGEPAELVVKPAQSAGSRDTGRFAVPEDLGRGVALASRIHAEGKVVMAQPYLASVDTRGETALMYFGGAYSHAIRKGQILEVGGEPIDGPCGATPEITAREPTHAERRLGDAVMAWLVRRLGRPLAYARVDVVEDDDGHPVIIELELTEPQLYLMYAEESAARLARTVRALAG